jgi:hypothetical protein
MQPPSTGSSPTGRGGSGPLGGPARGFPATFPLFTMNERNAGPVGRFFAIAYAPANTRKRALPGPLFDLSVVGVFFFVAVGYALT